MAFTQPEGPQQSPTKEEVADVALDKHLVHEDHQIQEQLGLIPTEAIGQGTGLEGSEKKGNKVVQLPRLVKKAGAVAPPVSEVTTRLVSVTSTRMLLGPMCQSHQIQNYTVCHFGFPHFPFVIVK